MIDELLRIGQIPLLEQGLYFDPEHAAFLNANPDFQFDKNLYNTYRSDRINILLQIRKAEDVDDEQLKWANSMIWRESWV